MRNLTIFFGFVCIFQIVLTKPVDEKLNLTRDDSALIKDENKLNDMETSENNIVFRPLFVYRQQQAARRRARQHQRCRRHAASIFEADSPLVLPLSTTTKKTVLLKEKTAKKLNESDLVPHETGLVFRPLFVYRQQQASRRRIQAERRNQAERRYYQSQPSYNHSPHYYKPAKKDCHDSNKELYI